MTLPSELDRRPTNVRMVILFLTVLVAFLLYLDRICLGFVEIYMTEELHITKPQMSMVLNSFFLAYALAQVPSGWLSDRYGARIMLSIYLAAWSVCTGLMGLASGVFSLILLRLGCGLFQAGAYPTCAGLIRKWIPFERRGLASATVSVGGRLGGAFATPLTAYLMLAFVPIAKPSLLHTNDILPEKRNALAHALQDPDAYFQKIAASNPSSAEKPEEVARRGASVQVLRRISSRLPPATVPFIKSIQTFRAGAIEDEDLVSILSNLNAVLGEPDLFQDMDLHDLNFPGSINRLFARETGELSSAEVERRNRIVLETVLPDVVRKIQGTGWRPPLFIYGALGVLVAILFWSIFRNSPRQHPGVNAAEVALIEGNDPSPSLSSAPPPLPWKAFLESRSLWLISAVQFLTNLSWVFLISWFPRYLAEEHGVPIELRGWLAFLPLFVGIPGMFFGGWLTDWTTRRFGVKRGRMWPICVSRFVAGGAFLACLVLHSPWPITFAMALVAFATDVGTPSMWAYSLDVGGKNIGSVLGWGNMWGNLGAFVSIPLLQATSTGYGANAVFLVCAASFTLAGFLSLGVDATKPIATEAN